MTYRTVWRIPATSRHAEGLDDISCKWNKTDRVPAWKFRKKVELLCFWGIEDNRSNLIDIIQYLHRATNCTTIDISIKKPRANIL